MKRLFAIATVGFLTLQLASPVLALKLGEMPDKAGSRPGLMRDFLRGRGRAAIGSGEITAKTSNSLTVKTKDGKSYTVNIDSNTQLRRRFWGKATWEEISVGDMVNVIGQWTDDTHTAINAKLVRDASIQKRFGVFIGTVTNLSPFTIETKRGTETVTTDGSTKFVNRKEETIARADIKVGDKIRVRGLWDSKLNTITEVSKVKDYSLPLKTP